MDNLHISIAEAWLNSRHSFPDGGTTDYSLRLQNIETYLFDQVHDKIALFSTLHKSGILTDHGPKHIRTVLRRAGELVHAIDAKLTGYELYLLILAIHFHDVGNMLGRIKHEAKITEVFQLLGARIGSDNIEKRIIRDIAKAHGGHTDSGSKDTVNDLRIKDGIHGATVRTQLLAAILRFADELAEDRERANVLYLNLLDPTDTSVQKIGTVPPEGEAFHKVSTLIYPVDIDSEGQLIKVIYELSLSDVRKTFRRLDQQVYLIDEILIRILKTYEEKEYFSQFTRRYRCRTIEQMTAEIQILDDGHSITPLEIYSYTFRSAGYPSSKEKPIDMLVEHESNKRKISGELLKDCHAAA